MLLLDHPLIENGGTREPFSLLKVIRDATLGGSQMETCKKVPGPGFLVRTLRCASRKGMMMIATVPGAASLDNCMSASVEVSRAYLVRIFLAYL